MKKNTFYFILLFISQTINAQIVLDRIDPTSSGILFRTLTNPDEEMSKVKGSPYQSNEFILAEIAGASNKVMIRYNIFKDIIEIQFDNKQIYTLAKQEPFSTISPINKPDKIKLTRYVNKEGEQLGYLTQIYASKQIDIYRKDRVNFQKAKEASSSYHEAYPAQFIKLKPEYYWNLKNNQITLLPGNKKGILELYPDKKEAINNFFKSNKIDFDEEKNIIELSKFIQTLQ
jgi:hypothetical protein